MKTPYRLAVLVCAACTLISLPARSQEKSPQAASVFGGQIDVRVVNVEVVVTDRQGNRVTGLKPGDFRLLVDRKPVAVEYFTEVREGEATAAAAESGAALPGVETAGPIGTNYLVFIDDFFSIAAQRDIVLASLERDLGRLGPQDRMAVVAWNGRRLARLAGWSRPGPELAGAIRQAMARPTQGLQDRLQLQSLEEDKELIEQSGADITNQLGKVMDSRPALSLTEIAYAHMLSGEIEGAVTAVVSAMRGSGAPAGRKVLLLLCGGWPFSLEGALRGSSPRPFSHELRETEPILRSLTSTANLLGYTVYPVDVPGLTTTAGDIRSQPALLNWAGTLTGLGGGGGGGAFAGESGPMAAPWASMPGIASAREQEVEGTLYFLAKETGGKALLNGNRVLALARASTDTRTYYWLGFTPAWRRDGKTHRLEVKVLRPRLTVRSRTNFADLSLSTEREMTVESALLFGDLPEGEPLTVRLGVPASAQEKGIKKGVKVIPVTLEIPASAVTLLPADGGYAAKVELRLAATDDRGNQSDIPVVPIDLSSPTPPAAGQSLRYETRIFLRGQARRVVAVIYDPLSGKTAAGEAGL